MIRVHDILAVRRDRCYSAGPGTVQTERNQTIPTDSKTYTIRWWTYYKVAEVHLGGKNSMSGLVLVNGLDEIQKRSQAMKSRVSGEVMVADVRVPCRAGLRRRVDESTHPSECRIQAIGVGLLGSGAAGAALL